MIHKIVTVISAFAFISCSSCQSDSKDSNKEIQTSHKSVDSLTTNDVSQFQRTHLHCLLDSLNLNDTLYVTYLSYGCEYHWVDSIRVYYQSNKLYANLTYQNDGFEDKKTISNYVSDSAIIYYRRFEKFLKSYKPTNRISTSSEVFRIRYKTTSIATESMDIEDLDIHKKLVTALFGQSTITQLDSMRYH